MEHSPSARTPLIQRPSAPLAACLRSVSYWNLFLGLLFCFFVGEWRSGRLRGFAEHAEILLLADVCYIPVAVLCVVSCCISLRCAFKDGLDGLLWTLLWAGSMCYGFWFCLLRISDAHKLEVVCTFHSHHMKGYCQRPPRSISVQEAAFWLPVGLFRESSTIFWRPWYYLGHITSPYLRHGWVGQAPTGWYESRQVLIGSVFWSCFVSMVVVVTASTVFRRAGGSGQLYLLLLGALGTVFAVYFTFVVTSPPMLAFWHYLARVGTLHGGRPKLLTLEECVALLLLVWWCTRLIHAAAVAKLEEWDAKAKMEACLQSALAHPFRAEFKEDWENPTLSRTLSRTVSGAMGVLRREQLAGVAYKQKSMTEARQRMLRDSVADPDHDLPSTFYLHVARETVLQDSLRAIFDSRPAELLAPHMRISYVGEEGVDVGGLTRDWFDAMARAMEQDAADGTKGLLATAPDSTITLRPKFSGETEDPDKFRSIVGLGRFLALAVFRERPLPMSLSLLLCKHVLRAPVGMDDVRQLDPMFYQHRVEAVLKDGGLAEMESAFGEPLTFMSAPTEFSRIPQELVPGGQERVVSDDDKRQYVQLLCEHYLCGDIRREIQCMLQGFWDILPLGLVEAHAVNPRELSVLISGIEDLDPEEWCRYSQGSEGTPQQTWFWEVVQEMGAEERCMLLHFATGSSRVPPGGFGKLSPKFQCEVTNGEDDEYLPHAHTCVNKIVLHGYPSKEVLKKKLTLAISTQGFAFY